MSMPGKRHRNRKSRRSNRTLPGAPPGVLIREPSGQHATIAVMSFSADAFQEQTTDDVAVLRTMVDRWPMTWINIDGVSDAGLMHELGALFGLHRLALEDVVHVHQRAKAEVYGDVLFVVAQMPLHDRTWETEQLSLFVGRNFVLSFQERPGGDCLDAVRLRIRTGLGRTRCLSPGYLMYALLDSVIDSYFPLLEESGERLDVLEEDVLDRPDRTVIQRILDIKRDLRLVRRAIWPLRDAMNSLLRDSNPLILDETKVYLRDCHDHTIQIIDLLENYRELASGLTDVYLSNVSNNTNEAMKVLTIISTIFIPLTFIVGVYGMNFQHIPEFKWEYGYAFVWGVMLIVGASFMTWFYRKGWLRRSHPVRVSDAASAAAAAPDSSKAAGS